MNDNEIVKAFDILDKFEFFGGQRAGRELWFNKPADIQEKDIGEFLRDIAFLKQFIDRQQAKYEDLQEQFRHLDIECERLEKANESQRAGIESLQAENEEQHQAIINALKHMAEIKSEARKEFAERLKKELFLIRKEGIKFLEIDGASAIDKAIKKVDNLVKEMEREND